MIADYGITKTKDIVLVDKRNLKQAWKSPFLSYSCGIYTRPGR